ncbi:hypothetical protein SAMD00023353_0900450 [Rosellinia necatrix]|uniref:Uncharacterized protein n=1 Tax=Rosellinia necatrix TaxID=77044 RepID=A0A1S8A681_ROSNE|nr:hypothetical protein SAMD00023353_0900450 [Rosellinia necatrix]
MITAPPSSTQDASSGTTTLPQKTCDSHLHCSGPSLGHLQYISHRDTWIVSSVLVGTAIIVAVFLFFWCRRRRKAKKRAERGKDRDEGVSNENGEGKWKEVDGMSRTCSSRVSSPDKG